MYKPLRSLISIMISLAFILSQVGVLPTLAANGDPVFSMAVVNKIDVALAVGPTMVDYSTFEADLRAALKDGREHPIPDEDIYIIASKTISASTTSEFSWWTYDHTRPDSDGYGGVANISDVSHMYSELSAPAESIASPTHLQNGVGVDYAPNVWGPGNPSTATTIGILDMAPPLSLPFPRVAAAAARQ